MQHILTFSRQTESVLRPVKLDVVLDEVLKLLRASLSRGIDFRTRVEPLTHPVLADSTQIHQIVMNLCTNAAHAMREDGGVLEVVLAEFVVDEHSEKAGLELSRGSWARISVSDTGHGIDDATMEHIFEPFFTTKQDDGGTGLGLSTVHGIVKQHGGTITVYSEPGRGTIFHVYLPLARNADAETSQVSAVVANGNGQRILVVDDEEPVALMLSQMLEKLHYSVTICANGIDALDAFRVDPDRYDLVLTDHAMPRMNGQQLVKEVKRIRPHLPILMATGFDAKIDAPDQTSRQDLMWFPQWRMPSHAFGKLLQRC